MTRPTQFGPPRAILQSGALGYNPDAETEDLPDPIDRALEASGGYAAALNSTTPALVQHSGTHTSTPTLPSAPTPGNILLLWKSADSDHVPVLHAGFTNIAQVNNFTGNTRYGRLAYRVVQPGDTTTVGATNGDGGHSMSNVSEWSGVDLDTFVAASTANAAGLVQTAGGTITPSSALAAFIVGFSAIRQGSGENNVTASTASAGTTQIPPAPGFWAQSGNIPNTWIGYKAVAAASPDSVGSTLTLNAPSSMSYCGVTVVLGSIVIPTYVVPIPEVNDGDDATYATISGAEVLSIQLDDTYRIVRARLRIATATAGSRTYRIFGANTPDFSDEVELDSTTFTALGSNTAQDVTFNWTSAIAYQYYRLEGDDETRRIHSFELYEAPQDLGSYATLDELDAHTTDTADAHDASAISVADAGGFFSGTDVEAILQTLGLAIGVPTAPITMRYTFSTTTTDADPGAGNLRLSNATQYLAVTIRADLTDALGIDMTGLLDVIATTPTGFVRLQKREDPTKWLVASVSASASPSGYRNITIANISKSSNSPFANGDAILMSFIPTSTGGGGGGSLTVEEVDGSPTDSAVTKIVFPNGSLGITSHVATYTPPGGGAAGGWKMLQELIASASATLDFTAFADSSLYDDYQVRIINLRPATNSAYLNMRVSLDGGSTWEATNYYGRNFYTYSGGAGMSGATDTTAYNVADSISNSAGKGMGGYIDLIGLHKSHYKKVRGRVIFSHGSLSDDLVTEDYLGEWRSSSTAINAIRLFMAAGNITEGLVRIYGLPKA